VFCETLNPKINTEQPVTETTGGSTYWLSHGEVLQQERGRGDARNKKPAECLGWHLPVSLIIIRVWVKVVVVSCVRSLLLLNDNF